MGRATRGADSRTRVAVQAAATNGAKDARRSRALHVRFLLSLFPGVSHKTGAHADSDCLPRSNSDLSCARTDVVAVHNFLSAHVEQCAQPPALHPRRSDVDPTAVTSFVRSRPPWCGPSPARDRPVTNPRPSGCGTGRLASLNSTPAGVYSPQTADPARGVTSETHMAGGDQRP